MSSTTRKVLIVASIALLNAQFSLLFVEPWTAQIYVPLAQTVLFVGALVFLRLPARRVRTESLEEADESTADKCVSGDPSTPMPRPSHLADPTPLPQKLSSPYLSSSTPDFGVMPRIDDEESLALKDTPPASRFLATTRVSTDHLDEVMRALENHDPQETFTEEALASADDLEEPQDSTNSLSTITTEENS